MPLKTFGGGTRATVGRIPILYLASIVTGAVTDRCSVLEDLREHRTRLR